MKHHYHTTLLFLLLTTSALAQTFKPTSHWRAGALVLPYAGGTYFLHEAKKYAKSPSLLKFCMKIYASLRYKLEGSALLRCLICGRSMPLDFLSKIQKGYSCTQ